MLCLIAREPGPKVIKLFSYSAQPSMKFIMLINVKMPTIVVNNSMINTTSEGLKARRVYFSVFISS